MDLPLKVLFEAPQLDHFAALVQQAQSSTERGIERVSHEQPLPLSFAQQRLWFLDQLEPESAFYNIPILLQLTGQLNVAALESSFRYLIARHESLRTVFRHSEEVGTPLQLIQPPTWATSFTIPVVPVTDEAAAQRLAQQEVTTSFDLSQGPLLRAQLLQVVDNEASAQRYLLVINMHHIISDGWSLGILIQELNHAYRAYTQGSAPTLPNLPIQYADFALWQRAYLSGSQLEDQLAYWRKQLSGAPALLELPSDRPRTPVKRYNGSSYEFQLASGLVTKLNQLAQQHNATLFMVLLAAFDLLLARYSRQNDISVGTPIANRNRAEIEGLIGFFVNTLVLRTQVDDAGSFIRLLEQVRQTTLDAYAHQDLPFEQLVDELAPTRTLSYSPLFQVMLVLQNAESGHFELPQLTATMQSFEFPFAKFDLSCHLVEQDNGLLGIMVYSTDLFDAATITRMATHFTVLLEGIVTQPDQPLHQLPMLTAAEYHQIIYGWNDTAFDYGAPQTIHALFEQQVERTPDAVALIFEDTQLTYSQLNIRVNQLAYHLIGKGIGAGAFVGICIERSIEMVVSVFAILKAGAAYVPLEASYPEERLAFLLQDAQVEWLLTQAHLQHRFAGKANLLCLDQIGPILDQQSQCNPANQTTPDELAYVIYTSGSTGKPKGAMVMHRGITHSLLWRQKMFQLTTGDRLLQKAAFSFDVSVWELCWPLLTGAGLVLAAPGREQDSRYLVETIINHSITFIHFVPSVLKYFLAEPGAKECTSLRRVWSAGEALTNTLQNSFFAALSADLFNGYGLAETSTAVMYQRCQPDEARPTVSIGRPITHTQIYILDQHLTPVPIGVPGELHIGGISLAKGYHNRPELTNQKFIPNPFREAALLYKTGDLARYLPDGRVEFLGRLDYQVKIRGARVELGEIENTLLAQTGVREAVVLLRENRPGDQRLVAYLVGSVEIPLLRQQLLQELPEYMVPSTFVLLDSMPLTPNGKLDRQALPVPSFTRSADSINRPRTLLEQQILEVWEQTLGVYPIGIHDDFFAIGGHSLLAVQLIAKLQMTLKQQLPLRTLFAHPTVALLATAAEQAMQGMAQELTTAASSLVALRTRGAQPPIYCVPGAGGGVLYLYALAQAVGEQQPFYGLESLGFDGKHAPFTTVEAAAAYQTAQILQHRATQSQPEQPYYIAGHSFGGLVAYEIAQQLCKAGATIGALLILDTRAPTGKVRPIKEVDLMLLYERVFREESGQGPMLTEEQLTPLTSEERLLLFKQSLEMAGCLPVNSPIDQIRGIIQVALADAHVGYLPIDFAPMPIHLFLANDEQRSAEAKQCMIDDWAAYGDVTVHQVPGTHTTMMYMPHVAALAREIVTVIQNTCKAG